MPATENIADIVGNVPEKVLDLVARFHEHRASYQSQTYNETQLRRDFLDPFFAALGWDMNNASGTGEDARDVIHEYSMKIDGKNKAPDYCFRNGTTDKFFVEAKKPFVNLKDDPRAAFQTRVYGWNRNLPFCILTDFEEFAVYDCRFKPKATDSAQTARAFYCKYDEYETKWPQIEALFGREAVRGGSLEKQATQTSKKGTVAFDQDFLRLIEGWRERLAENIARRNRVLELSQNDLNYAVQMTIDRVLFLRMCEDRDIEPSEQLKKLVGTKGIYAELLDLFRQADNRYNSGLFHFSDAKSRSGMSDKLTPTLQIDDNILSDILYSLYLPNPYNFRVMSVEILGQVYEQFLGKVIRLDKTKTFIEDKPEVRKAGGVYYTPSYIVDYIVRETVGKMCWGKTPRQIETLRVLDPACGSGSFLLGAYNFLLEWHLDYYTQNEPEKLAAKNKPVVARAVHREMPDENQTQANKPVWRLTTSEKKRILQNNIFGVDIDRQAVEVSKLSLLLKMLEDENSDSLPSSQGRLLANQERILPDIDGNIKCGNSLIGNDFYDDGAHDDLTGEERNRINTFDWDIEYSKVMKAGGFDCVIGNPPYGAELTERERSYVMRKFALGTTDTAALMMAQARKLLNSNGLNGFIVPKSFTYSSTWSKTRGELINEITQLCDVGKVWKKVKLEQTIYILQKAVKSASYSSLKRFDERIVAAGSIAKTKCVKFGFLLNGISAQELKVAERVLESSTSLGDLVSNTRGGMFQKLVTENKSQRRVVGGAQVRNWFVEGEKGFVDKKAILPTNAFVKPQSILVQNIVAHIMNPVDHIKIIAAVSDVANPDIVILDTVNQLVVKSEESSYYVLALLQSNFINWYVYRFIFAKAIRTMHFDGPVSDRIPIRTINFSDKADVARHDAMVKLVEQMLALQTQLSKARTSQDETSTRRQIASTDARIDKLVYELYDLTPEEIAVIESS